VSESATKEEKKKQAQGIVQALSGDEMLEPVWIPTDEELETIWNLVSEETGAEGVFERKEVTMMMKAIVKLQREKLHEILSNKEDKEEELEERYFSAIPRWVQWGVGLPKAELENQVKAVDATLQYLHSDRKLVSNVMATIDSNKDGKVEKHEFFDAVRAGVLKEVELKDLEEDLENPEVTLEKKKVTLEKKKVTQEVGDNSVVTNLK